MRIVFMGTPDFSVPVLKRLIDEKYQVVGVVTQPDRPKGRKKVMTSPPVKVEAQQHEIPVFQPEKIKNEQELEEILALKPDLVVTAAFGQILPKKLLEAPAYGCINVHASLLPKYRGGAPIHQAIIDGETNTGVTIMYMVEKLDAGDILTQTVVPILEHDHVGSLHDKLSEAGAALLSQTIPALVAGEIDPIQQDGSKATFASNITRDQEVINWSKTGTEIYNQIRGLHPWPVAYTTFEGKTMKIWWAEKVPSKQQQPAGVVVDVKEDGMVVATGDDTAIKIVELQPSGKKRMNAEQFLRGSGSQLKPGMKLGE
ncbi:methionyl-tRNA formyltransferase [Desertibacillus haloalkaliphilus]|uniref:methionyl-tRNA formyltransferase n=1 Tax=Desertibacillus haloalkaliphilus TaxID=1328930 RepID=UPI001C271EC9|nr:methionyl-tRNA formyltransferase [Desertibacillus haloalkaliphilus]MBU8907063.1 methionyl-tRNA formyltransferase [Desertibacillus haloalkaliphilus]